MRRHFRRTTVTVLAGAAAAVLLTGAATPPGTAKPKGNGPSPTIEDIHWNGSGCRGKDSGSVAISDDGTAFTVIFNKYVAVTSSGSDAHLNCNLRLKVGAAPGYSYTIASVDYRGYGSLAEGASGMMTAKYSYTGAKETVASSHPLTGPMDDDWQFDDPSPELYGPCGKQRQLTIQTDLYAYVGKSDPKASSFLSMDSTDGSVVTYHLAWKAC